ncbi:MAG TPA: MarR family transcriptional regulator [Clostridia bacterium]|nr:MarR family transcriptional regulator [Clostridia bacterium]
MEDIYISCHRKLMELSWRVISKSRCNLAKLGFAWNQFSVMKTLEPGKSFTISDISNRVNRKNSNVTPIIDFLVSKAIVERFPDEKDRRVIRVILTDHGVLVREEAITSHDKFIMNLYGELEEKEMLDFIEVAKLFLEKVK